MESPGAVRGRTFSVPLPKRTFLCAYGRRGSLVIGGHCTDSVIDQSRAVLGYVMMDDVVLAMDELGVVFLEMFYVVFESEVQRGSY